MQLAIPEPLVRPIPAPWEIGAATDPAKQTRQRNGILSERVTSYVRSRNRISMPGREAWREIKAMRRLLGETPLQAMPTQIGADVACGDNNVFGERSTAWPFTTGILADYDADLGVHRFNGRDRVTLWETQLGSGGDADQAASANMPAYTVGNSNFNGHGSVNGDGSAFWMAADGLATAFTGNDTPFYVIAVARWVATGDMIWVIDSSLNSSHFHYLQQQTTADWRSRRRAADTAKNADGGTPDTSAHVIGFEFTGTLGSIRVDGPDVITDADLDNASLTVDQGTLFARRPNGTASAFGDVEATRLTAFSTVPSDANKDINDAFAGDIYGITIS